MNIGGFKVHPAAELFPMLPPDELRALADDIAATKQIEPVVLFKSQILDGRNRTAACELLGRQPRTRVLERCDSPTAFVLSANLRRRHLEPGQRAAVAAKAVPFFAEEAKAKQAAAGGDRKSPKARRNQETASGQSDPKRSDDGRATTQAAKSCKAGTAATKFLHSIERTYPNVFALVADALVKVSHGRLLVAMPDDQRGEAVAAIRAAAAECKPPAKPNAKKIIRDVADSARAAVAATVRREADTYRVLTGDLSSASDQIDSESVDVIITDPPYPEEYLHVYGDLARIASRVLKPGGSCVVMVGQSYLPQILASMTQHLEYQWMLAYLTPGGQSTQLWDRKVNTFWKPLLWLVKGTYGGSWKGDVAKSDPNDNDKTVHRWGQSESGMADIVRRFSEPGDTILDPFCGGGTTGAVALDLGRRFIGIDKDEQQVANTLARIAGRTAA